VAPRLVTKADFARIAGCGASSVSRGLKGELRLALVHDRIDVNHWAAKAFIQRQRARKGRP